MATHFFLAWIHKQYKIGRNNPTRRTNKGYPGDMQNNLQDNNTQTSMSKEKQVRAIISDHAPKQRHLDLKKVNFTINWRGRPDTPRRLLLVVTSMDFLE